MLCSRGQLFRRAACRHSRRALRAWQVLERRNRIPCTSRAARARRTSLRTCGHSSRESAAISAIYRDSQRPDRATALQLASEAWDSRDRRWSHAQMITVWRVTKKPVDASMKLVVQKHRADCADLVDSQHDRSSRGARLPCWCRTITFAPYAKLHLVDQHNSERRRAASRDVPEAAA